MKPPVFTLGALVAKMPKPGRKPAGKLNRLPK